MLYKCVAAAMLLCNAGKHLVCPTHDPFSACIGAEHVKVSCETMMISLTCSSNAGIEDASNVPEVNVLHRAAKAELQQPH